MQAWFKENEEEASTVSTIAIHCKRGSGSTDKLEQEAQLKVYSQRISGDEYIKFIAKFGPALAGITYWNYNKASVVLSELLTITDEAFIHLCIINYAKTWKAQEKNKCGGNEKVPVSKVHYETNEHDKQGLLT
jgi:hypothetical protein